MNDFEKSAARMRQSVAQRRRRSILWRRCCANIDRSPWLLVCSLLLLLALGWAMTRVSIPFPGGNNAPALIFLWNCAMKVSVWLMAFLLAAAVLTAPPTQAKALEAALTHIKFVDRYGDCPALISKEQVKSTSVKKLVFYSAGISLESWVQRQGDIQDAFNAIYVEPPQYAYNKRYYVVLTVAHGTGAPRKEILYDDEL